MNKHKILSDYDQGYTIRAIAARDGSSEAEIREYLTSVGYELDSGKKRPKNNYATDGSHRRRDSISPTEVNQWMRQWRPV